MSAPDLNVGAVVVFKEMIQNWDGYFDANMLARLEAIKPQPREPRDDCTICELVFNVKEFDEHNRRHELANYWDEWGCSTLTAREVGSHPKKTKWLESVYVSLDGDEMPFSIVVG